MKCEIQKALNIRYRILKIDGNTYILDMSQSIWKIILPFLTWVLPHTIYKVDGEEISKLLKSPIKYQKKNNISILFTAGIGIFLGNILTGLTDYFYIPSTLMVNSIIVAIVLLIIILIRSLLSIRNRKNLYKILDPNKLLKESIWIRPMAFKHFVQCLFVYIFFLVFFIASLVLVIEISNILAILFAIMFGLALFITNGLYVVEGHTTVKFKKGK
ncbi:DUF443 family protein [Alkalihalobacterium sp. APHAB7]|uniref:DUF443 family protein n=1 Tax=Alkalihalobacterium sp. APHAB7 TaxID=3402081 RepID=UPI003AAC8D43